MINLKPIGSHVLVRIKKLEGRSPIPFIVGQTSEAIGEIVALGHNDWIQRMFEVGNTILYKKNASIKVNIEKGSEHFIVPDANILAIVELEKKKNS